MIQAKTMTFKYNPHEDRIEFILNYDNFEQRIDLMMTRKLLLKFFDLCEDIFIKYKYKNIQVTVQKDGKTVKQEVKQINIKPTATLKPHEKMVDNASINLAKKVSLLMNKVEFKYEASKNSLNLAFFVNNKMEATLSISMIQFEQIIGALIRVVPFVEWGISPNILEV